MNEIGENALDELMEKKGVDINSSITSKEDAKSAKLNPGAENIQRKGFQPIGTIINNTESIYERARKELEASEIGTNDKTKAQELGIDMTSNTQNKDNDERIQ